MKSKKRSQIIAEKAVVLQPVKARLDRLFREAEWQYIDVENGDKHLICEFGYLKIHLMYFYYRWHAYCDKGSLRGAVLSETRLPRGLSEEKAKKEALDCVKEKILRRVARLLAIRIDDEYNG